MMEKMVSPFAKSKVSDAVVCKAKEEHDWGYCRSDY
jgi:hypothetical protein